MGGWTFASPALLGWAAAATIPILLHLLMRRRYQETRWAAMQFLQAALRRHARRLRIEQWILLFVRTLLLLLAAFAWAEPLSAPSRAFSAPLADRTLWLLVVDDSYSLQYAEQGQSLWEDVKRQVATIVQAASPGDAFLLLAMGKPPRAIVSDPVFAADAVLTQLEDWQPRDTSAELAPALNLIEQLLDRHMAKTSRWQKAAVCFVTDLQATTWNACQLPDVRRLIARLTDRAQIQLIEVGGSWQNAAVTRLELKSPVIRAGDQLIAVAEIRRYSANQPRFGQASWLIDGQPVATVDVDLSPGSVVLNWSYRLVEPGPHTIGLKIDGLDPLAVDNQRFQIVMVRDALRVLCVYGDPRTARPLIWAMQPSSSFSEAIQIESVTTSALRDVRLNNYQVIWLCNVPPLTQEEVALLTSYVQAGGGLIISLGDLVQPSRFNQSLAAEPHRLAPARLGEVKSGVETYFDPLNYRHPAIQVFAGQERAGLLTLPIWRYCQLLPWEDLEVRAVLAFANGDPAIVERDLGAGRVALWATAAGDSSALSSTPWNESAAWPSFVPLVHELLWWVVSRGELLRDVQVGEPLGGYVTLDVPQADLRVVTPRGASISIPISADADSKAQWQFEETWWSGCYRVECASATERHQWYAVNVDPQEGDLSRMATSLLPAQFHLGPPAFDQEPLTTGASAVKQSWSRALWAVVFGLLLLESFLSWRFGAARGLMARPTRAGR